MVVFLSQHRNFTTYVEVDGKQVEASFSPSGEVGLLKLDETKDQKLIEALRKSPFYDKNFSDKKSYIKMKNQSARVLQGMITADRGVNMEEEEKRLKAEAEENVKVSLLSKFKRFDELKSSVAKASGEKKTTATDEEWEEYEELKKELNL